jgi:peroxiredoxin
MMMGRRGAGRLARRSRVALGLVAVLGVGCAGGSALLGRAGAQGDPKTGIGRKLSDFRLPDSGGHTRALEDFADKKALVVVFLGTKCPVANSYAAPLEKMSRKYQDRSVQFIGINANTDETLEDIAEHARDYQLFFPVLKDARQAVANALGAQVTPEAFVLDQNRAVRYRGRIDDGYATRTQKRPKATTNDLENALEAVLADKPVATPVTKALGCAIVRPEKESSKAGVTYYKDVAPILQERCQSCHRAGQIAPFTLASYADAKKWAGEIKEFTSNRQMPPWKAEPNHGEFADSRRLTDAEVETLARWADAGTPAGRAAHAPKPRKWADGWTLGTPDLVLKMPEPFAVEATGEDVFHCFVLPTNLTEDQQVVAVEIRPGNARVLHHVLNFVDTTGQGRKLDEKHAGVGYPTSPGGIGFFPTGDVGGWAPGNMPRFSPDGVGRFLPKGSDIVIQVHYHKTGKPETDQTTIGLYFAKEPIKKQLRTWPLTTLKINIPPDEARHEVKATMRVPADVHALTITPHMHLLGKEMKVTATFPDGKVQPLIFVKDWDYRWQDTYRFREPVALPKGTRLDLTAAFDNSTGNPRNPSNPPKRVTFGEQTTDEMCFAFIEYTMDQEPPGKPRPSSLFGGRIPAELLQQVAQQR